jgi:hypothetical protein
MVLAALAEGLDASAAERIFGYRQATITTWLSRAARARSDVPRAVLPRPLAPTPPTGRTADETAELQARALAVAGHRSHYEDSSRPSVGSPHAVHGAPGSSLPATDPSRLSAFRSSPVMA